MVFFYILFVYIMFINYIKIYYYICDMSLFLHTSHDNCYFVDSV